VEQIRDVAESDFLAILGLNEAEALQTSHIDFDQLQLLVRMSSYCKVAIVDGQVAAFLIALSDGAPYENDNFAWFSSRLPRFVYVDRVVVDSRFSGRGIGSKLYNDLFRFARTQGIRTITCEYNIDPPNPASRAFHDKFGFRELGTQWVAGGSKRVSLQAVEI